TKVSTRVWGKVIHHHDGQFVLDPIPLAIVTDLPNNREPGRTTRPAYLTNISASRPVGCGQLPGSVGFLEVVDMSMPIGIASVIGRTDGGMAVWGLRVHGAEVPGRWVIIDRRLVP